MKNLDEEKLREEYTIKKHDGLEEAKRLDHIVKLPVYIFAYSFGVLGALILGLGMCLAMQVIGSGTGLMILGIMIGIIGIAIVSMNYPIFKHILQIRKEKYASQILLALNKKE